MRARALLLCTFSVLPLALCEAPPPPTALHDALSSAVLPPVQARDLPPVDADSWALLLEQARQAVQRESSAPEQPEGVRVVRETFFVPVGPKVGGSPARSAGPEGAVRNMSPVQEARVIAPEEAADIVRTVSKLRVLRPLFTYAIHHPLRFLGSYVLLPLLHLLLSLLSLLVSLVLALLTTLLSPATFLFSTFVLVPISAASSFASATAPIWYALLAALVAGTLGGALAGLVAARPARSAIDGALARGRRGLRWLGVLPKEQDTARGGYGPGATLERTSEKARGKRRATLGEQESSSGYEELRDFDEETDGDVKPFRSTSARLQPLLRRAAAGGRYERARVQAEEASDEGDEEGDAWGLGEDVGEENEASASQGTSRAAGWRGRKVDW